MPSWIVDAIVRVQGHELDALVEVLADGAVGLVERLLHDQDRRADVHPEAVLLEDVAAPARPLLLLDHRDVEAHVAQPQRRGQPAQPCTDDDD